MSMDNQNDLLSLIQGMNETNSIGLTNQEMMKFQADPMWGVPLNSLKGYLGLPNEKMTQVITSAEAGVPLDSIDGGKSEFQLWVTEALNVNEDIKIAIKADADTPYANIKKLMSELQDMNQNRYYLITSLKTGEDK